MKGELQTTCMDGAALAPLKSKDRQDLAALGRQAWERLGRPGGDYEAWRHARLTLTVERSGLRQCRNEDYAHVRADFLGLLGREPAAQRWRARAATEPRRVALWKLRAECARARDVIAQPEAYVASIARCKYRTADVEELAANQIWTLVYDVRRAAQARRKNGTGNGNEKGVRDEAGVAANRVARAWRVSDGHGDCAGARHGDPADAEAEAEVRSERGGDGDGRAGAAVGTGCGANSGAVRGWSVLG